MVKSIAEFTDNELECIDNKLCIKCSKKLLTGNYFEYYKNGNVKRRIEYKNGILDGVVENFREDGKNLNNITTNNTSYNYKSFKCNTHACATLPM